MQDHITQTIFLNNALGHFYRAFIEWFSNSFYQEINTKVISTYTKAISKLNQRINNQDDFDVILPAIILDPSGEINPDDKYNHLWRYDSLAPDRVVNYFEPLYQDDEVMIVPIFNRFVGEMEVTFLLRSIYEYLDLRIYLIQTFNNTERYNRPFFVYTFLTIPDELLNLQYDNLDGTTRPLDWTQAQLQSKLITNMNTNENVVPLVLTPIFKYTGVSDASNRKAVGSELEDYKLTVSITYEIELPVYFYIKSDYKLKLPPTISIAGGFAGKDYSFPASFTIDTDSDDPDRPKRTFIFRKIVFFDINDDTELDSVKNNGFQITENFEDYQCIKIAVNDDILQYWDDYKHDETDKTRILFSNSYKEKLKVGDHIEIAIYDPMEM